MASACRSKRTGHLPGTAHWRGSSKDPRQVLVATEAVTLLAMILSGASSKLAEAICTGSFKPRTSAWTDCNWALPSASDGVKADQEPAIAKSTFATPSAVG